MSEKKTSRKKKSTQNIEPEDMNTLKQNKKNKPDIKNLQEEVASFASSLGFATATNGFDDSDFRKKGTIKPKNPNSEEKSQAPNAPKSQKNSSKSQKNDSKPPKSDTKSQKNDSKFQKNNSEPQKNGKSQNKDSEPQKNGAKHQKNKRKRDSSNNNKEEEVENRKPSKLKDFLEKSAAAGDGRNAKGAQKFPLMKPKDLSKPWYEDVGKLEGKIMKVNPGVSALKTAAAMGKTAWQNLLDEKWKFAEQLMAQYVGEYEKYKERNADLRMVAAAEKSGTSADKVAAITILVQDNPVANLKSLDAILGMMTSKVGKRHAASGIDSLKELFLISLLPDRKLKYMFQQPLNLLPETNDGNSLLLFWYWEDCLKKRYERFVVSLEDASKDNLPFLKDKAVKTLFFLLKDKPEQERRLLSALVNKLGDPERKIASNAGYHLSCLLTAHPNMKAIVVEEVDNFVFRPNLGMRTRYNVVLFLNQIFLSNKGDGSKLARRLVDIYFALFKVLVTDKPEAEKEELENEDVKEKANKKCGNKRQDSQNEMPAEIDSRLLSALLTGVNRAFPFVLSDEADTIIERETPVLFQLVHSKSFNIGVQALMLLYQLLAKNQTVSDRFFRAIYSIMLTPSLMKSSKTEMFLGLLLKAMKSDINSKRVAALSKRLLQVSLQQPPQFSCACLLILSELLKARPPLWNYVLQPEDDDKDVEHFVDIVEEEDQEIDEPQLVETVNRGPEEPDAIKDDRSDLGLEDEERIEDDQSDLGSEDEERIEDDMDSSRDDSDEGEFFSGNAENNGKRKSVNSGSQVDSVSETKQIGVWIKPDYYDPRKREPAFCNADSACWWELTVLAAHAHPSVAAMAKTLLIGSNIIYNGDPLTDLCLGAFIDKFLEKKPKASKKATGEWHGGSQIAPARKVDSLSPLLGSDLLNLTEEEVSPEDVVFHRFYLAKANATKRKLKKKKKDQDIDGVDGDELYAVEDAVSEDEDAGLEDEDAGSEEEFIGGDESDNEEIDDLIDEGLVDDAESDGDKDYDYDKLDDALDQEDETMLADDSEGELPDIPDDISDISSSAEEEELVSEADSEDTTDKRKQKKDKVKAKKGASPFASFEDYSHLLEEDDVDDEETTVESPKAKKKLSKKKQKLPKKRD